jgi:hypothetical protein
MTTNQLQEYYEEVAKQKWPNATKREVTLEIIIRDFGMHQYKVSFYAESLNEEPENFIQECSTFYVFGGLKLLRKIVNIRLDYPADISLSDFADYQEIEIPGFIPKGIAESTRKQIIKILSNIQS